MAGAVATSRGGVGLGEEPAVTTNAHDRVLDALRTLIWAVERQLHEAAGAEGVALTDILALSHLRAAGDLSQTDLAERVSLSSSAATSMVDRLERRGLVVRTADPVDRRKSLVRLTPVGAETALRVRNRFGFALELLADHDLDAVEHALTQIADAMLVAQTPIVVPHVAVAD